MYVSFHAFPVLMKLDELQAGFRGQSQGEVEALTCGSLRQPASVYLSG